MCPGVQDRWSFHTKVTSISHKYERLCQNGCNSSFFLKEIQINYSPFSNQPKQSLRFTSSRRLVSIIVFKSAVCCRLQVPSAGACLSAGIPRPTVVCDVITSNVCLILCRILYCGNSLVLKRQKHLTQAI